MSLASRRWGPTPRKGRNIAFRGVRRRSTGAERPRFDPHRDPNAGPRAQTEVSSWRKRTPTGRTAVPAGDRTGVGRCVTDPTESGAASTGRRARRSRTGWPTPFRRGRCPGIPRVGDTPARPGRGDTVPKGRRIGQAPRAVLVGLDLRDAPRGDRGLFWSDLDLDLDLGVLRVRRALVTGYGQTLETPETAAAASSSRERPRRPCCVTGRQAAQGFSVDGDALVFTNTVGRPIKPVAPALPFVQAHPEKGRVAGQDLPRGAAPHLLLHPLGAGGESPRGQPPTRAQFRGLYFTEVRELFAGMGDDGAMDSALS
jgi:hypothetical protein